MMKRFFTLLLFATGTASLLCAQVTMTKASHGFFPGQNHECREVQCQSPGETGKNCVWDFSKATLLDKESSVSDLTDEGGTIKAGRNDGVEFFFVNTESANEYWGYKAGNASLQLTVPIVKTQYPQTFGTQFSGKFSGIYSIEGSNYTSTVEGTYSTFADAIGVIKLPNENTFTALRVKTTEGNPVFERVKYLWYAQEIHLPIFVIMEEYSIAADGTRSLLTAQSYINTKAEKSPTSVEPSAEPFSIQVYPNPFKDELQLNYTVSGKASVTVALYSPSGTQLATLVSNQVQSGSQTISRNVSKYTQQSGIYLLKITIGDKTYTEKLVKN